MRPVQISNPKLKRKVASRCGHCQKGIGAGEVMERFLMAKMPANYGLRQVSLIWCQLGKTKKQLSNRHQDKQKLSGVELETEEMAKELKN
jgi:hypothetical protein